MKVSTKPKLQQKAKVYVRLPHHVRFASTISMRFNFKIILYSGKFLSHLTPINLLPHLSVGYFFNLYQLCAKRKETETKALFYQFDTTATVRDTQWHRSFLGKNYLPVVFVYRLRCLQCWAKCCIGGVCVCVRVFCRMAQMKKWRINSSTTHLTIAKPKNFWMLFNSNGKWATLKWRFDRNYRARCNLDCFVCSLCSRLNCVCKRIFTARWMQNCAHFCVDERLKIQIGKCAQTIIYSACTSICR